MKLSKTLSFNQRTLEVEGFTCLGKYTPKHQQNEKGDHALVIMFQPFKGKWVQALGCFLSKGSANGTVLHQLLVEAIILAERAGLKVDGIANDGASWNRSMWDRFGVNEENVSVEHIYDSKRRLWFFSDFPHLIKCFRNYFTKHDKDGKIWTPDGVISLKHWYALLDIENPKGFQLKVNYKLREEHIKPQFHQKMNVALAFQFFGIADSLELLKNEHHDLVDCDSTIKFCRRVKSLITAMNSRTPVNNLKPGNEMWQNIETFLKYLYDWEREAKKNNYEFFTPQTCYGFKISLKGALEICKYLINECGFNYLLTSRLSQDNLERFFGMMRHCCGSNDHPDSALFIQMYKLVSTYSLIKPPKGSNVEGGDLIDVLIKIKDIENNEEKLDQWNAQIDTILDKGLHADKISDAALLLQDHNYFKCLTSDYVLAYVSGFVARKFSRFAIIKNKNISASKICYDCKLSLVLSDEKQMAEENKLIELRSKGYLIKPSAQLFLLISKLESAILNVVNLGGINSETIFNITSSIEKAGSLPLVGCHEHN